MKRGSLERAGKVLLLAAAAALSGCQTLYTGVLRQDDPAAIVAVPPEYRLPFPHTREGFVLIQGVGGQFSHRGRLTYAFDWAMPRGTPVLAARDGVVVYVDDTHGEDQAGPLRLRVANVVKIRHDDGTFGVYAHLQENSATVREGETVAAGRMIAWSGNTGFSTEPHLHFHVEDGRGRTIPIAFVDVPEENGVPRAGRRYRGSFRMPAP